MTIIPYTKDKNTRKTENITKKAIDSLKDFVNTLSNDFVSLITNEIKNGEFELSIYKYLFNPIVDITNTLANNLKIKSIEQLDEQFFNSKERKSKYASKGKKSRTIITIHGKFTYSRYSYVNKHTGKDDFYENDKIRMYSFDKIKMYK